MADSAQTSEGPIQYREGFIQGYGGPDVYWVQAVYRNHLLEERKEHNSRAQGYARRELEDKWNAVKNLDEIVAKKPPASRWCDNCGQDTLGGSFLIGDKNFCKPCANAGAVDRERESIQERQRQYAAEQAERVAADERKRQERLTDAQSGFHWRNNWFFKRMDDGSVRVSHTDGRYVIPELTIPPNEWASIVCSVSRNGETSERWNEAQDFHGR